MEGKFEGLNRMLLADNDPNGGLPTVLITASLTDHQQTPYRCHLRRRLHSQAHFDNLIKP
jgi:hypothetical protein